MIARPQAELLNMLPVTQVSPLAAKALEGGTNPRFDAALLEAAKTMRDSAPQAPELTLVPRVQRAFESALSELSQKPLDQLKTLAEKPAASRPEIAAIVTRTAQAAGLNAEETAVLNDLVPLALPRVLEYRALIQVPGTSAENTKIGGVQPGPQGGTPVREASPADFESNPETGIRPGPPEPTDLPAPDTAETTTAGPLAALNQALAVPVLVSTRTDDGSGRNSALTQARVENTAPVQPLAASAPAQAQPQGRVIQVTTAQLPPTGPKPATVAAPQPPMTGVSAAPVTTGIQPATTAPLNAIRPQAAPGSALPQVKSGPSPQGAVPADPRPATAVAPPPAAQPESATRSTPSAQPFLDVQIQTQETAKPLAIVPGSELTLQEDGTWIVPAQASAKAPVSVAPQGAALPVSEAGNPATASAPQAPAPSITAPSGPATPQAPSAAEQVPSVQPQTQAPAAQAPTRAPESPTLIPAAPGAPASAQGMQAEAAPLATASTPPIQVQGQAAPVQPLRAEQGPARPAAESDAKPEATEPFQAPAASDSVQARRTAGDSAFGNLAQFGQDPMKAMAQQTARDYAVRESVFRQVTEALREAPETDSGRMHIRLKPAELGEVTVDLVMANGKLSARLVTSQMEVRDAFVRDLHAFKAGLESQGVVVRDISVAVRAGVADQQQQQPQQQQAAPRWWRELPLEDRTPILASPASYGGGIGATDQRFSALA